MPISTHDAEQRIREAIARKAAEETILTPVVGKPGVPIFLPNPQEWLLYVISMLKNSFRRQSQKLTSPSSWP